mgnify:CR=1 FL=1
MKRSIARIVVHCTATAQTVTTAQLLDGFRRRGWTAPGYHLLVFPAGSLRCIWPLDRVANGARGYNATSVHVAWVGGVDASGRPTDNRTPAQRAALRELVRRLARRFPGAEIVGHRDLSPDLNGNGIVDPWERVKECPCFDVRSEYVDL